MNLFLPLGELLLGFFKYRKRQSSWPGNICSCIGFGIKRTDDVKQLVGPRAGVKKEWLRLPPKCNSDVLDRVLSLLLYGCLPLSLLHCDYWHL